MASLVEDELFGSSDDDEDEREIESFELACITNPDELDEAARSRLLASRDPSRGVMNFRGGSEEALLLYVQRNTQATPTSVLRCCDVFCYGHQWMMHSGDKKRALLERAVATARLNGSAIATEGKIKPLQVLELGAYCGYSAVLVGSLLNQSEEKLVSLENDARAAAFARRLLKLAGPEVNDRVEIVDGDVAHARAAVDAHKLQGSHPFGLLFLDHAKDQYLPDLKHLLAEGLLAPGCVVVADNICFQGESHTEYLNFVRQPVGNGGRFVSSEYHAAHIEYACASSNPLDSGVPLELRDGVEVSQLCDDATSASELA